MARWHQFVLALALVLAAGSVFLSVLLFTRLDDQQTALAQSRVNITFDACQEQNGRHDKTVAKLDHLISGVKDPVQRARAQANRASTVELLEALAPHQDCAALVKRRFGPGARPS